ncbi:MAG: GatB/YqeY domain-containing protein [Methylacidiphilales bacterium]|nr:GatB/YqeY domain-containing protein [Candidatus Methylacidiphilales bacterium]
MELRLKIQIQTDCNNAIKQKRKEVVDTLRLLLSAIKQFEVDTREPAKDSVITSIITKQIKQRKESIELFNKAGRTDLVTKEQTEMDILQTYLPEPLLEAEVVQLVIQAIATSQASSVRDMGKVMAMVKPQIEGRFDLAKASQIIKEKLP